MAKTPDRERIEKHRAFALKPPRISVLSDQALKTEEAYLDSFNLHYQLGPIYDILRHPDTDTPLAIAIFGSWGTGKTTAMRWLHGLLGEWNEKAKVENKIRVRTVWFYPWKYDSKEDVWRGLIAEVIIKSLSTDDVTMSDVVNAAKRFGLFLGRGFVHALAALKLKAEVSVPGSGVKAGAEVSLSAIKDILEEYRETSHPERGFLNEFEDTLRTWVKSMLGERDRMVIFIDDLDRCMPDVALQVLEALKLYLNIDRLIFVVGVDRGVVDKLVAEHYHKLGLDRDKSKHYLAKMFQVDVDLAPSVRQIEVFLDEQLKRFPLWREQLVDRELEILRTVVLSLADRNPREVKRLINSAMVRGAGVLVDEAETATDEPALTFKQSLQLFFVHKILTDRYTRGLLVGQPLGDRFFGAWSTAVRGHENVKDFPRHLNVPSSFKDWAERQSKDFDGAASRSAKQVDGETEDEESRLSFAPTPYHVLLRDPSFGSLLEILGDEDLGELMRLEYPVDTSAVASVTEAVQPDGLIREAIARQLGMKLGQLTDANFAALTTLDLQGMEISDISSLSSLTSMRRLILSGTQVSDLGALRGLSDLTRLDIRDTPVADVAPLSSLVNLEFLDLGATQLSDMGPLGGLMQLNYLYVWRTEVSDLAPLRGLNRLTRLFVSGTRVSDVSPLSGLTDLQALSLSDTNVSDIGPLSGLAKLEILNLRGTQVSDVGPLSELTNIEHLDLERTQVSDVRPLHGLPRLRSLDLTDTPVSDEQSVALRTALPNLEIIR